MKTTIKSIKSKTTTTRINANFASIGEELPEYGGGFKIYYYEDVGETVLVGWASTTFATRELAERELKRLAYRTPIIPIWNSRHK